MSINEVRNFLENIHMCEFCSSKCCCFLLGVEIFTFGVESGNVDELTFMASEPKQDHVFILNSFAEFESVARRALHAGSCYFM